MTSTSLSVVVPVFNAESILELLVTRLEPVLDALCENYEVILVNDGSQDTSWDRIALLAENRPWLRGIDLMRNYGQHNALLCGIRAARGAVVVTLDDDLQNPPEEIPKLLKVLEEKKVDVVYGDPDRQRHGLGRDLASVLSKLALQKGMGIDAARYVSAFRAFRTDLREAFAESNNSTVSIDVLLTWGTCRFGVAKVRHDTRIAGQSGYSFPKLMTHAVNMIAGYTTWPLRIASLVGFGFTIVGVGVLVYVVGRFLITGTSVPGFPFLASIIAIFSGAQLFSLGIIGEYLARIYDRSQGKASSVVRRTTNPEYDQTTIVQQYE